MLSRRHRFHGLNSLRQAYRGGQTAKGAWFGVRALNNERRKTYRVAVVVSRKVSGSAVARNRMRRRLYEAVRGLEADIKEPYDIIITVFNDALLEIKFTELAGQLKKQFKQAGII